MSVVIKSVERGSYAEKAGIKAGETLLSINGKAVCDILDYRYYETDKILEIEISDAQGNIRKAVIHKGEYQSLGLDFETYLMDRQRCCKNKCVFCFIDQLPEGMRETLYFKDDDERLSFLFGNYITLTNLTQRELERITQMHISPVNVSVHTTNPKLRVSMMKNPVAGEIMDRLRFLADGGTKINCQLVLCPGINDGEQLERSLRDLLELAPQVQSIALVPVGLTKHREGLEKLRLFTREEAGSVIDTAHRFAAQAYEKFGSLLVWAADEFYITAGREVLSPEHYEDYPQLENGVGMIALLRQEFADAVDYYESDTEYHSAVIATGVSAAPIIDKMLDAARDKWKNAHWRVVPIINEFFGKDITVAGLVTGGDMITQLRGQGIESGRLLIPAVMLRREGDIMLDGTSIEDIERQLGVKVSVVPNDGDALLSALLGRE